MNKKEFIDGLRRSLSSINDYSFVNDTISYYENYIDSQMRMGKSEQEVMEELGDPRLIAKSIRATHVSEEEEAQNNYNEFENESYTRQQPFPKTSFSFNGRQIQMPSWLVKTIAILFLILVFFVVFTVLRWLSPFILMAVVVYLIYRTFFGKY